MVWERSDLSDSVSFQQESESLSERNYPGDGMKIHVKTLEELLASGWYYDAVNECYNNPKQHSIIFAKPMEKYLGQICISKGRDEKGFHMVESPVDAMVWLLSDSMLATESELLKRVIRKL